MLALFFTAIYVGLVVGVGALVGTRGNVVLSVVATAVFAVAFQPFRARASRLANRIVYGERATPYEVLSEFADRMGHLLTRGRPAEDGRDRGRGDRLGPGGGVAPRRRWLRRAAAWPAGEETGEELVLHGDEPPSVPGMDRVYAVQDRGELLGALAVAKPPSAPLTAGEDRLVRDIASQAGLVLRNVRPMAPSSGVPPASWRRRWSAAASSATSTTGPSSGWSRWR